MFVATTGTIGGFLLLAGIVNAGQALTFPMICYLHDKKLSAGATGFHNMITMISGIIFQPLIGRVLDNGKDAVPDLFLRMLPLGTDPGAAAAILIIIASLIGASLLGLLLYYYPAPNVWKDKLQN